MIDVIVSGGLNLTVEDTGDIISVVVEVAAPMVVEVVVGVPTKENIVGLTKVDSPEFADVVIPEIAEETSYTASAWAWLTGLFGTVTGSVKAMLVALVERVASLDERVGELEDAYLVKVEVEQDVAFIELSQDKNGSPFDFKEGEKISVLIQVKDYGATLGRIVITINDVTSPVYNIATSQNITYFITAGTRYKKQYTTFNFALVGTEIQGELFTDYTTGTGVKSYQFYTFYTDGLNCFNIRKLNLTAQGALIPAGSVIIIKRI